MIHPIPRLAKAWSAVKSLPAQAAAKGEIFLYGQIGMAWFEGDGVLLADFRRQLDAIPDGELVSVRINSPGGFVDDGIAMYNLLMRKAEAGSKINVTVDALAASIASVIAMAGDTITMAGNAQMMIHDPWGAAIGDADDMRKAAEILDKNAIVIRDTYAARTRKSAEEIAAAMAAETWYTAEEAVTAGLADAVSELRKPRNGARDAESEGRARAAAYFRHQFLINQATKQPN